MAEHKRTQRKATRNGLQHEPRAPPGDVITQAAPGAEIHLPGRLAKFQDSPCKLLTLAVSELILSQTWRGTEPDVLGFADFPIWEVGRKRLQGRGEGSALDRSSLPWVTLLPS